MEPSDEQKAPGDIEDEDEIVEQVDPILLKPDLYAATVADDTEKVLELLNQSVPPTFVDTSNSLTALHWAAMNGNVKLVVNLLKCGASEPYHRLRAKAVKELHEREMQDNSSRSVANAVSQDDAEDDGADRGEQGGFDLNDDDENSLAEDEDEEEEEEDVEKALEVSVDLLKNTPLLWATYKGHLQVIWHLLKDGYSPNDTDTMGNNALHLAAALGDMKVLKVLVDDGASANVVNQYKNLPVDMSKTKDVRDLLRVAMEQGASMTEKDIAAKHEKAMAWYDHILGDLSSSVTEASMINQPNAFQSMSASDASVLIGKLSSALSSGREWCLDGDLIKQGENFLLKLELSLELLNDLSEVEKVAPIRTQTAYIQIVTKLEQSLERAHEVGIDKSQLDHGLDLLACCQIEYWLSVLLDRLKDVVAAEDCHEHDMNKLRKAIDKAEKLNANADLVRQGTKFLNRLFAELGMTRAIKNLPEYKLPPPDGVVSDGYWTEKDTGHIQETEGYPLPPADTGEYVWIPSESYTALQSAITDLSTCYLGADELGANPDVIAESQEKLFKAEKDFKLLEAKNEADREKGLEVVKKMAKKLKGGKKKKK